ncbi:MAG: universal stress protein [Chloroflexi bacterium]|nr:universal stress protein [Chloroflexota bacterium]
MKILLAVDGSPYAQHAAEHTADLCRRLREDSEVLALHVKDAGGIFGAVPIEPGAEAFVDVEQIREGLEQTATIALDAARRVLEGSCAVRTLTVWGRPVDVICGVAESEAIDLIVIGSRGMGRIAGLLMGSVSDQIVHRATRPVLVIRGAAEDAPGRHSEA